MSFAVHMAAHGALVSLAIPLALLALRLGTVRPRAVLERAVRRSALGALTYPPFAWATFVATQLAFHLTPLYDLTRDSAAVDALAHLLFFTTAVVFWLPVVLERLRGPGAVLYLLAAMPAADVAAVALMLSGERDAGAAMIASMMPLGAAAAVAAWRWIRADERDRVATEAVGGLG